MSFHKGNKNVSRVTTNEEDEVSEGTVAGREGSADITMNTFKNTGSTMEAREGKGVRLMLAFAQIIQDWWVESSKSIPSTAEWSPLTPMCPIRRCKNPPCLSRQLQRVGRFSGVGVGSRCRKAMIVGQMDGYLRC